MVICLLLSLPHGGRGVGGVVVGVWLISVFTDLWESFINTVCEFFLRRMYWKYFLSVWLIFPFS